VAVELNEATSEDVKAAGDTDIAEVDGRRVSSACVGSVSSSGEGGS